MVYNSGNEPGLVSTRKEIKILVVDDPSEHFESLRNVAEMYNPAYSVELRLVSSSQEAVEVTSSWKPSVVLLDLHVVSEALQLVQQLSDVGSSVLATSEVSMPGMFEKVTEYGAVGYQPKSENLEDLESLLGYIASIATPLPSSH